MYTFYLKGGWPFFAVYLWLQP